jgi:MFS family permease
VSRGAAPLGLLAFGHVISQWLRTLPAIAASDLAAGLGFGERGLAVATGLMALAFTLGQVPVGVLLDRIGPRRTALALLALAAAVRPLLRWRRRGLSSRSASSSPGSAAPG